jgi:hypothetical protein
MTLSNIQNDDARIEWIISLHKSVKIMSPKQENAYGLFF